MKMRDRVRVVDWLRERYGDNAWSHNAAALATMANVELQMNMSSDVMSDIRRASLIPKPTKEAAMEKRLAEVERMVKMLNEYVSVHDQLHDTLFSVLDKRLGELEAMVKTLKELGVAHDRQFDVFEDRLKRLEAFQHSHVLPSETVTNAS